MTSSESGHVYSPPPVMRAPAPVARDQRRRGAVAEERGRYDVALREVVAAKAERAQLHDEEEHERAGIGARHRGGAREADRAAGAA